METVKYVKLKLTSMLIHLSKFVYLFVVLLGQIVTAQDSSQIKVKTLLNLNASGGMTSDQFGNIFISDFGKRLGGFDSLTHVYKWNPKTEELSVFATGFKGASGACFDTEGNFYQSNPFGHSISKIEANGAVNHEWCMEGMKTPVGLESDSKGSIYVSNCGLNEIGKISPDGKYQTFAKSELFKCPNGLTQDDVGNLYACNFSSGHILKITQAGEVSVLAELPTLKGGPNPVGNGHIVYSNGWLFVTTIGTGELYRLGLDGSFNRIVGKPFAFKNTDGDASTATFSKPNGIAASVTGDTLYINVSEPSWASNPAALYPAKVVMITGICSFSKSGCAIVKNQTDISFEQIEMDVLDTLEVRSLYRDKEGDLWIGTKGQGIFKLSGEVLFKLTANSFTPEGAISIMQDSQGAIWLAGKGLWKVDDKSITSFPESFTGNRVNFSLGLNTDGGVVVSGSSGVSVLKENQLVLQLNEESGLGHSVVHDAYQNESNEWWLATRKVGLNKYEGREWKNYLTELNCRKILPIESSKLLIGVSDGLIEFNTKTKEYKWVRKSGFSLLPTLKTEEGVVWCVGDEQGLWRYKKGKIRKVKLTNDPTVFSVEKHNSSQLLIGTDKGIVIVNEL